MAGVSLEFVLMLGYAISLALIALLLELAARHAHRRSLQTTTAGFTYHPDRDIWRCPQHQHLFPIFSDSAKGVVIYRAPAAACNSCRSKAACTDSNHGRDIERRDLGSVEYGMKRFHHAMSITLLVLASLILGVEAIRESSLYPRIVLIAVLTMFCLIIQRLLAKLLPNPGQDLSQ
jgi:heme A synthase